jgi:hypothetical protein
LLLTSSPHPPPTTTIQDDDIRRLLWYAAYLTPMGRIFTTKGKRSTTLAEETMLDALKRPKREVRDVAVIQECSDAFNRCIEEGGDISSSAILYGEVEINTDENGMATGGMIGQVKVPIEPLGPSSSGDPIWSHAMSLRLQLAKILRSAGPLWRAGFVLCLSERISQLDGLMLDPEDYEKEREAEVERFNTVAAAMITLKLFGGGEELGIVRPVWDLVPLMDGNEVKGVLKNLPRGPEVREVMDKQLEFLITTPGAKRRDVEEHLMCKFKQFL